MAAVPWRPGARAVAVTFVLALAVTGCVGGTAEVLAPDPASSPITTTPPAATRSPSPSPATPSPSTGALVYPVSIQALMQTEFDGRDLRIVRTIARGGSSTTSAITYRGGGLRLSGIMRVPRGDGPFPVVVLAHGYIDPDVYRSGRGFERTQRYLADAGFAVVHVDYRNHAGSDRDPDSGLNMRLGYTEDVVNAVLAVKSSSLPSLDRDRVGLLGRSMGGGVAYNALVAAPDLVGAAAVFAPVSSDTIDNFDKWIRPREQLAARILRTHGTPADNPVFWRDVSPRTFFDRIQVPVMVHHGTADDTCPIEWSEETVEAMRAHGVDVTYHRYRGEGHQLYAGYDRAMRRTVSFFRANL